MTLIEDTRTAAVTEVVARLQHAQQHELVEEFVALFRPDAIWTTGGGRRLVGRDAIAAFTRQVLPGAMRGSTQTYEVEHVVFLRPDVAAVTARQRTVGPDGVPVEGAPAGSPTYVMTEEDGRWLLAACQNTLVVDGPDAVAAAVVTAADEAAIRGIIGDVEAGFNSNDVELSTRHFADDALATSALGAVNRGLPALVAAHRAGLAGPLRDATAHYRVVDVTAVGPDVAVALKQAWTTEADADSGAPPQMVALYVLARRSGRWLIVRRQNTLVAG